MIDYETPVIQTVTRQDQIYTTLLAVLGVLQIFGVAGTVMPLLLPNTPASVKPVFLLVAFLGVLMFAAIAAVFVIRLAFPEARRWPTFGLNILLLIMVPFGTAVAIYGFWKVDKKLPRSAS